MAKNEQVEQEGEETMHTQELEKQNEASASVGGSEQVGEQQEQVTVNTTDGSVTISVQFYGHEQLLPMLSSLDSKSFVVKEMRQEDGELILVLTNHMQDTEHDVKTTAAEADSSADSRQAVYKKKLWLMQERLRHKQEQRALETPNTAAAARASDDPLDSKPNEGDLLFDRIEQGSEASPAARASDDILDSQTNEGDLLFARIEQGSEAPRAVNIPPADLASHKARLVADQATGPPARRTRDESSPGAYYTPGRAFGSVPQWHRHPNNEASTNQGPVSPAEVPDRLSGPIGGIPEETIVTAFRVDEEMSEQLRQRIPISDVVDPTAERKKHRRRVCLWVGSTIALVGLAIGLSLGLGGKTTTSSPTMTPSASPIETPPPTPPPPPTLDTVVQRGTLRCGVMIAVNASSGLHSFNVDLVRAAELQLVLY